MQDIDLMTWGITTIIPDTMGKKLLMLLTALPLLLTIAATMFCYGCSEYKTFTLRKGIGHFTFEYPAQYKVGKVEVRSDLGYTDISLNGLEPALEAGGMDYIFIDVFIEETSVYSPNAESALEHRLAFNDRLVSIEYILDYRLLQRSSLSVGGVQGQQIVYYYDAGTREYPEDPEPEPLPIIEREVYFDHGDLIWCISIKSDEIAAEDAKAIFQHILETFRILD